MRSRRDVHAVPLVIRILSRASLLRLPPRVAGPKKTTTEMTFRQLTKNSTLYSARRLGVNSCLRHISRRRLLVLCYHAVVPDDHPVDRYRGRVATSVSDFSDQMAIVSKEMEPISANDLLDHISNETPISDRALLVTFDDGFRNNLQFAAPVLERYGVPALFHLSTGYVGSDQLLWTQELDERIVQWSKSKLPMPQGRPDKELPADQAGRWLLADQVRGQCKRLTNDEKLAYLDRLREEPIAVSETLKEELYSFLTWEEARELDRRGFEIGAHTISHPILTSLSPQELDRELAESKLRIEKELGKSCPWLAYPNGSAPDYSPLVIRAAKAAGYQIAFTLLGRNNADLQKPFEIDRVCVPGEISRDAFDARLNGLLTFLAS